MGSLTGLGMLARVLLGMGATMPLSGIVFLSTGTANTQGIVFVVLGVTLLVVSPLLWRFDSRRTRRA